VNPIPHWITPDNPQRTAVLDRLELGYGFASPVCAACGKKGHREGPRANVLLGFIFGGNLALGSKPHSGGWGRIYEKRDDKIYRTNFMPIAGYYPWDEDRVCKGGVRLLSLQCYNGTSPPVLTRRETSSLRRYTGGRGSPGGIGMTSLWQRNSSSVHAHVLYGSLGRSCWTTRGQSASRAP